MSNIYLGESHEFTPAAQVTVRSELQEPDLNMSAIYPHEFLGTVHSQLTVSIYRSAANHERWQEFEIFVESHLNHCAL